MSHTPVSALPARDSGRWPVETLATTKRWPYQQEVVLVPDGDGWYSEIPVLGEAT